MQQEMIRELLDLQERLLRLALALRSRSDQRVATQLETALAGVVLARLMLEGEV